MHSVVFSQCISSGAKNSSTFSNNAGVGSIAWLTPSNTATSDNIRTTAGSIIGLLSTSTANWNMESGFGFSLPAYAIICGIKVDIEKRQQGVLIGSSVTDNSVRILKAGVITGSEHAAAAAWPATDTYVSYGSSTDTWGTTWTAADINSPGFGVAYSANLSAGLAALFLSAEVDHVQMTVFYDLILPIKITDFSATCKENGTLLKWSVANKNNVAAYIIEKTTDGTTFETVASLDPSNNVEGGLSYSFTDLNAHGGTSYYRLKQKNADDTYGFSSLITLDCPLNQAAVFYPNPSSGKLRFDGTGDLSIYNLQGKEVYLQAAVSGSSEIDLSSNAPGIYFYQLRASDKVISSGKLIISQ